MSRKTKRVVILSDMHCGHIVGLTPPSHNDKPNKLGCEKRIKQYDFRREMFSLFYRKIKSLGKIDVLAVNGDCIDGRGERSGGTEIIAPDVQAQCDMAAELIRLCKASEIVMTYGTPYHVGQLCDYEDSIAREANATKIGGHEWFDVNGVVFDMKHHIGSSSVPYGRFTAIARDKVWNSLWNIRGESPQGQVFIRSHVHYHSHVGDTEFLGMTTPALQGPGSKFGVRRCSGIVDWGFVHFDVKPSGSYTWQADTTKILHTKNMLLKF